MPRVLLLNAGGDLEPEAQGLLRFTTVRPEPRSPGPCGPASPRSVLNVPGRSAPCHPHMGGEIEPEVQFLRFATIGREPAGGDLGPGVQGRLHMDFTDGN